MYSMTRVKQDDLLKLLPVINMQDQFPLNDIYLGLDSKKRLLIEVCKKDFTPELLTEEVLEKTNLTTKQLIELTTFISNLDLAYKELHPEAVYRTVTEKTMSQMSMFDMAWAINNAVQTFNKKTGNFPS